jgi:fumarate hydratase subunit alpha
MRDLHFNDIVDRVRRGCINANYHLSEDVLEAYDRSLEEEKSPMGREILSLIRENAKIAQMEGLPLSQDTGMAVFFVELGQNVRIKGGLLQEAIQEGVKQGYKEGFLRGSVVSDPLSRRNTGDNTPAIIHMDVVPGDELRMTLNLITAGAENMSCMRMLSPGDGVEGVKAFVLETVREAGANPCPPLLVGVGIGGDFESAALLSKKALLRSVGNPHPKIEIASLEEELLKRVNRLGIGPLGFGGSVTALAVHVEVAPCHMSSFPVAVNLSSHSIRRQLMVL